MVCSLTLWLSYTRTLRNTAGGFDDGDDDDDDDHWSWWSWCQGASQLTIWSRGVCWQPSVDQSKVPPPTIHRDDAASEDECEDCNQESQGKYRPHFYRRRQSIGDCLSTGWPIIIILKNLCFFTKVKAPEIVESLSLLFAAKENHHLVWKWK